MRISADILLRSSLLGWGLFGLRGLTTLRSCSRLGLGARLFCSLALCLICR